MFLLQVQRPPRSSRTDTRCSFTTLIRSSEFIAASLVQQALDAKVRRADRLRERSYEAIQREFVLVDTDGAAVGQVNGLSVMQLGGFAFGRPSRITARVRMGAGKVIDIEREVDLGGPLHSKGVLILSAYLASNFAIDRPLSLAASLVFEQSYGGVDGDSASSAELYALLSARSEEQPSELQSLMRISYAVFCLKKKKN